MGLVYADAVRGYARALARSGQWLDEDASLIVGMHTVAERARVRTLRVFVCIHRVIGVYCPQQGGLLYRI